ncbi:MAG: archease [Candidatus Bathyarchaeota archaeon]|nr:MAG: archease [Candidatus Bathyarchaeota archaeon]
MKISPTKGFEILDHTADEHILAYGATLEEAFESAAAAMFNVMTEIHSIEPTEHELVEIAAEDEKALLYSWLEALLLKFDIEGKLYSQFRINKILKKKEGFSLTATIGGEVFSPNKHPSKTEIKAITYYQMKILHNKEKTTIQFVLDI